MTDEMQYTENPKIKDALAPMSEDRCKNCPPDRVCAWACAQGMGVLEILLGEALADQARCALTRSDLSNQALQECYE